jgi:hypothetical protein
MYDFPDILSQEYSHLFPTRESAVQQTQSIISSMKEIIHDLFAAYENEYSIFTPMSHCYELYGLDFIINENFELSFLEANPGPDFQQTGNRLSLIIEDLFEELTRLLIDFPYFTACKEENEKKQQEEKQQETTTTTTALATSKEKINQNKQLLNMNYYEKEKDLLKEWIPHMELVYSKEWSVNQMKNNFTFK